MRGLDPRIHLSFKNALARWMAGASPAMTVERTVQTNWKPLQSLHSFPDEARVRHVFPAQLLQRVDRGVA